MKKIICANKLSFMFFVLFLFGALITGCSSKDNKPKPAVTQQTDPTNPTDPTDPTDPTINPEETGQLLPGIELGKTNLFLKSVNHNSFSNFYVAINRVNFSVELEDKVETLSIEPSPSTLSIDMASLEERAVLLSSSDFVKGKLKSVEVVFSAGSVMATGEHQSGITPMVHSPSTATIGGDTATDFAMALNEEISVTYEMGSDVVLGDNQDIVIHLDLAKSFTQDSLLAGHYTFLPIFDVETVEVTEGVTSMESFLLIDSALGKGESEFALSRIESITMSEGATLLLDNAAASLQEGSFYIAFVEASFVENEIVASKAELYTKTAGNKLHKGHATSATEGVGVAIELGAADAPVSYSYETIDLTADSLTANAGYYKHSAGDDAVQDLAEGVIATKSVVPSADATFHYHSAYSSDLDMTLAMDSAVATINVGLIDKPTATADLLGAEEGAEGEHMFPVKVKDTIKGSTDDVDMVSLNFGNATQFIMVESAKGFFGETDNVYSDSNSGDSNVIHRLSQEAFLAKLNELLLEGHLLKTIHAEGATHTDGAIDLTGVVAVEMMTSHIGLADEINVSRRLKVPYSDNETLSNIAIAAISVGSAVGLTAAALAASVGVEAIFAKVVANNQKSIPIAELQGYKLTGDDTSKIGINAKGELVKITETAATDKTAKKIKWSVLAKGSKLTTGSDSLSYQGFKRVTDGEGDAAQEKFKYTLKALDSEDKILKGEDSESSLSVNINKEDSVESIDLTGDVVKAYELDGSQIDSSNQSRFFEYFLKDGQKSYTQTIYNNGIMMGADGSTGTISEGTLTVDSEVAKSTVTDRVFKKADGTELKYKQAGTRMFAPDIELDIKTNASALQTEAGQKTVLVYTISSTKTAEELVGDLGVTEAQATDLRGEGDADVKAVLTYDQGKWSIQADASKNATELPVEKVDAVMKNVTKATLSANSVGNWTGGLWWNNNQLTVSNEKSTTVEKIDSKFINKLATDTGTQRALVANQQLATDLNVINQPPKHLSSGSIRERVSKYAIDPVMRVPAAVKTFVTDTVPNKFRAAGAWASNKLPSFRKKGNI